MREKILAMSRPVKFILLGLVFVIVVQAGFTGYLFWNTKLKLPIKPGSVTRVEAATNCSVQEAVKLIKPNVYRIENKTKDSTIYGTGFFEPSGYLVTNSHVVDKKGEITVFSPDGTGSKAEIISNDINKDLAILTAGVQQAATLPWGDTAKLGITDELISLGYALNLPGEVSTLTGTFSARRSFNDVTFLQTSTAINPGSSGGPLVNQCGEVVGINTVAIDNASINLAISSESAKSIILSLGGNKKVNYIGSDSERETILSKEFKTKGTELNELNSGILSGDTTSASGNVNGSTGNSNSNSSQASENDSKKKPKPVAPTCSDITATKTSVEIDMSTVLTAKYTGDEGTITWSGNGAFGSDQDPSAYSSSVVWSNSTAGNYELTAKAKNSAGECSKSITISVLAPPTRIESLSRVSFSNDKLYNPATGEEKIRIMYQYRGPNDNYVSWLGRNAYVPVTLDIKLKFGGSARNTVYYQKSVTSAELRKANLYNDSFYIIIPESEMNFTAGDIVNPGPNGYIPVQIETTLRTPEQGSFNYTGYETFYRRTTI